MDTTSLNTCWLFSKLVCVTIITLPERWFLTGSSHRTPRRQQLDAPIVCQVVVKLVCVCVCSMEKTCVCMSVCTDSVRRVVLSVLLNQCFSLSLSLLRLWVCVCVCVSPSLADITSSSSDVQLYFSRKWTRQTRNKFSSEWRRPPMRGGGRGGGTTFSGGGGGGRSLKFAKLLCSTNTFFLSLPPFLPVIVRSEARGETVS